MKAWGLLVALVPAFVGASAQAASPCPPATIGVEGGKTVTASCASEFGRFEGQPQTEWLEDGRSMRLLQSFSYVDQNSKKWTAPKGAVVDGASIPRFLWSLAGGPFEGPYRNASVVHDTECNSKTNAWRPVHEMFYNGVRAGGVGVVKGKLMYWAVYFCGPRWPDQKPPCDVVRDTQVRALVWIWKHTSAPLVELHELTRAQLEKQISDKDPDFVKALELLDERGRLRVVAWTPENYKRLNEIEAQLFRQEVSVGPVP